MSILLFLHAFLVLAFTIRILLRDDLTPPGRLAWFVILILIPYFGSAVYFLFGENDLGRRADKRHDEVFAEIRAKAADFIGDASDVDRLIAQVYRPAFNYPTFSK